MAVSRKRPKGSRYYGPFGLSVLAMTLMPKQIGYQDLVALMARQPEASQRARAHMLASPFGTIHAATFSFPQPIGSYIPEPPRYQLASAGARRHRLDRARLCRRRPAVAPAAARFPERQPPAQRRSPGVAPAPTDMPPGGTRDLTPGRVKTVSFPRPGDVPAASEAPAGRARSGPRAEVDVATAPALDVKSETDMVVAALPRAAEPLPIEEPAAVEPDEDPEADIVTAALTPKHEIAIMAAPVTYTLASVPPSDRALPAVSQGHARSDRRRQSGGAAGAALFRQQPGRRAVGTIQPWPADEELQIVAPPAADPDFKRTALAPSAPAEAGGEAAVPALAVPSSGQTIAPKGEVTGAGKRPKTPAERLGLSAKERAKAEKCLTEAIYFESRGEVKRGQIAVAQVVMNRVFSGLLSEQRLRRRLPERAPLS